MTATVPAFNQSYANGVILLFALLVAFVLSVKEREIARPAAGRPK